MILVLTLLVKDEVDIIQDHLDYHLKRGIDFILVTDNQSTDGTLEILKKYAEKGQIQLFTEEGNNMDQSKWVSHMAKIAFGKYKATWVLNSDTDEFWWPVQDSFRNILKVVPSDVDVLNIKRYNFLPRPVHEGALFQRMIYRDLDSRNALNNPLPPKIMHRGMAEITLEHGNHDVLHPSNVIRLDFTEIEIFHFPLRTYAQYANKIRNGAEALMRNNELSELVGITWRKMYEKLNTGQLKAEFEEQLLPHLQLTEMIQNGRIEIDRRLWQYKCRYSVAERLSCIFMNMSSRIRNFWSQQWSKL